MRKRMNIFKKIMSIALCIMLMLSYYPTAVFATETNLTEVTVTSETEFKEALNNTEVDIITINGSIELLTSTNTDDAFVIPRDVIIQDGALSLRPSGIILGGDVTFRNIELTFANVVRNAIIANGNSLTLDTVTNGNVAASGEVSTSIHLFCGGVTDYNGGNSTEIPAAGTNGHITIKGTNKLGNIYAGSLSDVGSGVADVPNEYTGSAAITIENGASGFGTIYAHGARESRGEGTGDVLYPSAELYKVTGGVTIDLKDSTVAAIYGATGGETDAVLSYTDNGKGYQYSPILKDIGSLTLNPYIKEDSTKVDANLALASGSSFSSKGTVLSVPENTRLNLVSAASNVTITSLTGGGELILGEEQVLEITGAVNGTTKIAIKDISNGASTGAITKGKVYITAVNSVSDSFKLIPDSSNNNMILSKGDNGDWITEVSSDNPVIDLIINKISMENVQVATEDSNYIKMPVSIEFASSTEELLSAVPINITVNNTEALREEGYGYYYTCNMGIDVEMFFSTDESGEDCLYIDAGTSQTETGEEIDNIIPKGTYEIAFTIPAENMSNGEACTVEGTLTVTCEHSYGDDSKCTKCGAVKPCENHSWTYEKNDSTNAGTAVITGTCSVCSEENVITLTAPTGNSSEGIVYDGTPHEAVVTQTFTEPIEVSATYSFTDWNGNELTDHNLTKAGKYTAAITAGGQKAEINWTVNKAKLTVVSVSAASRTYDGTDKVHITEVVLSGIKITDDVSVELTNVIGTIEKADAGSYTTVKLPTLVLNGTAAGNYEIDAEELNSVSAKQFEIKKANPEMKAKNAEILYGETYDVTKLFEIDKNAGAAIYSIVEGSEIAVIEGTTLTSSKPGKVKIKVAAAETDNYLAGEAIAELTVKPKTLSVAVSVSKNYDGLNGASISTAELFGVVSDDEVSVDYSGVKAVFGSVNVGETITVTYTGEFKLTGEDAEKYVLTQPAHVTGSIINNWKPAENTEYMVSGRDADGKVTTEFVITAKPGYLMSFTNTAEGTWFDKIVKSEAAVDGMVKFYIKNIFTGEISNEAAEAYTIKVIGGDTVQDNKEPDNNANNSNNADNTNNSNNINNTNDAGNTGSTGDTNSDQNDASGTVLQQPEDASLSKDAAIVNSTKKEENAYKASLKNDKAELKEKIPFTESERKEIAQGKTVEVYMKVVDISGSVSETDKKLVEKTLENEKIGMYLDITVYKQIGEKEPRTVTNTNSPLAITFEVPKELLNENPAVQRTYQILRIHNNEITVIVPVFDETTKMIHFETDQFSTYVLVYSDEEILENTIETEKEEVEVTETEAEETAEMQGINSILIVILLLLILGTGMIAYALRKKK